MTKTITSYKAFNKDWTCRGFKYEVGKEYEHNGEVSPCNSGFHACPAPLSVLSYYPLSSNPRFAVVEQSGEIKSKDDKVASSKITVKAEIGLPGLIKAQVEYVQSLAKGKANAKNEKEHASATGDRGHASATGDRGHASATGKWGHASATGDSGNASATGDRGHASATGYSGHASATGKWGHASATGKWGHASATGDSGHASATGDRGHASATGDRGHASATGENAIAAALGYKSKAKASRGNWIVLAEYDDNFDLIHVKSTKVTGRKIKADTWYTLKDGKFVEAK